MKLFYLILLLLTSVLPTAFGQVSEADSLKKLLAQTRQDTNRVLLLAELTFRYQFFKSDTALILGQQAIALAQKLHFPKGEIRALIRLGEVLRLRGEYPQALESQLKALQLSRQTHHPVEEASSLKFAAAIYIDLGEYRQGLNYLFQSKAISERISQQMPVWGFSSIGNAYEKMGMLDSALYFQAKALASRTGEWGNVPSLSVRTVVLIRLGVIQNRIGNSSQALHYYQKALESTYPSGDVINRARSEYEIAQLYYNLNKLDSSIHYAHLSFANAEKSAIKTTLLNASSLLTKLNKAKGKIDSAFHYQQIAMAVKDSLFGAEKFQKLQLLTLTEQQRVQQIQQRQKEILQAQERYKNKISIYALLATVGMFLLLAIILYSNNHQKQKANALLLHQKEEINKQRDKAEKALENLKSAQAQLIQSEKMASLGELTAGIAHEIQNPLNFVNNFSEVSEELITELKTGPFEKLPATDKEEAQAILEDLSQNLEKIHHHGKRADSIVKNMLQHSRATSGEKQLTDINALVEEYLRLAYHGLRAKDKDFNAEFILEADPLVGKISVVPQEIGRVLLNLFNNAFYATQQKKIQLNGQYQPQVFVSTKAIADKVEIRVKDNGVGIPEHIKQKIFQPFFTTKPTGEGTGLGLSLSYDIVTKGHGGELKVESRVGEFTLLIIVLPK